MDLAKHMVLKRIDCGLRLLVTRAQLWVIHGPHWNYWWKDQSRIRMDIQCSNIVPLVMEKKELTPHIQFILQISLTRLTITGVVVWKKLTWRLLDSYDQFYKLETAASCLKTLITIQSPAVTSSGSAPAQHADWVHCRKKVLERRLL